MKLRFSCGSLVATAIALSLVNTPQAIASSHSPRSTPSINLVQYAGAGAYPNLPVEVAYKYGIFKRNGLNVTMQIVSAPEELAPLISGQEIVGSVPAGEAVTAIADGANLKFIMASFPVFPWTLWARPGITSPSQLVGKRIAVTNVTNGYGADLQIVLPALGLSVSQVTLVPTGSLPNTIAAALSGRVDVTPAQPGVATDTLAAAGWHLLVNPSKALKKVKDDGGGTYVATTATIKQHPQLVQRYVDSIMEAIKFIKTNKLKTEAALESAPMYSATSDQHGLQVEYSFYSDGFVCTPTPYPAEFAKPDSILARTEPAVGHVVAAKMLDGAFVASALKKRLGC